MQYESLSAGVELDSLVQARVMNRNLLEEIWEKPAEKIPPYSTEAQINSAMIRRLNQEFGVEFQELRTMNSRKATQVRVPGGRPFLFLAETSLVANCIGALGAAEYLDRCELHDMRLGDGRKAEYDPFSLIVGIDEQHLFSEIRWPDGTLLGRRERPSFRRHGPKPTLDDAKFEAAFLLLERTGRPVEMAAHVAAELRWKPCSVEVRIRYAS